VGDSVAVEYGGVAVHTGQNVLSDEIADAPAK
jgi:hypothetical protein